MNPRRRLILQGTAAILLAGLAAATWLVATARVPDLDDYRAGTLLTDRSGVPLRVRLGHLEQDNRPVRSEAISPWAKAALVSAEDKRFDRHVGLDPIALCRAIVQNVVNGRRISGASTLSTQVIRLTELRPRTLTTKLLEAASAIRMEQVLDKDAILEQHINRAPFGGNLTGIEAAARHYFDKAARDLTLAESALLMGVPQSPARLRPDRHPEAARKRMHYVLERMEKDGKITRAQRLAAAQQPVEADRGERPFLAPHFSDFVLQQTQRQGTLQTTLDATLQNTVERVVSRHFATWNGRNIHGAAVVILDVRTGAIRAMLGSPDYDNRAQSGMVNAATARRSPGSALKPFIYAMALEQGTISPGSLLDDSPTQYRDIRPDNFDDTYRGTVSARDALIQSLNIPVLRLTETIGLQHTLDGLRSLGLSTLSRPAEDYGVGIALGGGEVRLLDLVNAYACIARGGQYLPYRFLDDAEPAIPRTVLSPETAFMISDMLGGRERSMDLFGHIADAVLPRIAWKTGTSSGYRDVWTIAWNPDLVIGVWLGNPDGSSTPEFTGASVAAPIVADLFRQLCPASADTWFTPPEPLRQRTLADGTTEWYMPGISPAPSSATQTAQPEKPLQIKSPADGTTFGWLREAPYEQSIALQAAVTSPETLLHWFANGIHIGTTSGSTPLHWQLQKGDWTLVCSTPEGSQARATITVAERQ